MRVMMLEDDLMFGLKKGDVFKAQRYPYDPDKMTLLERESDGFNPECNQYKEHLAFMLGGEWHKIGDGGAYVPLSA